MKPSLLVLAAGIGSRYGGLKQVDGIGPSGEAILEYSVYDAINAGFGKVVFVVWCVDKHPCTDSKPKLILIINKN